jgi:uncharacterized membrane protein (DUF106 family)
MPEQPSIFLGIVGVIRYKRLQKRMKEEKKRLAEAEEKRNVEQFLSVGAHRQDPELALRR